MLPEQEHTIQARRLGAPRSGRRSRKLVEMLDTRIE
jgi:hypothetical protein